MTTTPTPAAVAKPIIMSRPSDYAYVDPRVIRRRPGWNNRFDFGFIPELTASIKAVGVQQPLTVRRLNKPDEQGFSFELVDGDRRLTAIEALLQEGHEFTKGVPVHMVNEGMDDKTARISMFVANTGKPLLPLEEAAAFKELRDVHGMTLADIATAVGRSAQHIEYTLGLLEADDSVKAAVAKGDITPTQGKEIAKRAKGDNVAQREIVAAASATSDKKARAKVIKQKVREVQEAKGRKLKMRALSDEELSELGAKVAKQLEAVLADVGVTDEQLMAQVAADNKLAAAFSLGAIKALRAAAGIKEVLTV